MYELVETKRQQKDFEKMWDHYCNTFGWYNDPDTKESQKYILVVSRKFFYQRERVIGTIEFSLYHPFASDNTVEEPSRFNFMQFKEIKKESDNVWEIDKVCIHEDYQRQSYFHEFFQIMYEHATENKVNYYISLMELKLYRMLRLTFGSAIEKKGNALIGSSTTLIPTSIHIGKMLKDQALVNKVLDEVKSKRMNRNNRPNKKLETIS